MTPFQAMTGTLLQQIREANRSFLAGLPSPLDAAGPPFVVVACVDARLTRLLDEALGLPRNRAIVIKTAGNRLSSSAPDRAVLRSVAVGLYIGGAREILVVGHTDCALANFSAAATIESFRAAGVARNVFGDEDLRLWFGAFGDVRTNIIEGIRCLRQSGLVPAYVKISGLLMDSSRGAIEVVVDGDVAPTPGPVSEPDVAAGHEASGAVPVPAGSTSAAPAEPPPAKPPSSAPMTLQQVVNALGALIARERTHPDFQRGMADVVRILNREKDPSRIVPVLERLVSRYESNHPDARIAVENLRKWLEPKGPGASNFVEILKRLFQ